MNKQKKVLKIQILIRLSVLCFNNLFQRNKLNTYNIKYDYHIMIIQHNNVLKLHS